MSQPARSAAELLFALFLSLPVSLFLAVIVHEAGHAAAGMLSGYRLTKLSFLGIECTKKNKELRIRLRDFYIGGQCLVYPRREISEAEAECVVLGGCAANFLLMLIMIVSAVFGGNLFLRVFSVCVAVFCGVCLIESAVPSGTNDGATFLEIRRFGCGNYNKLMNISCAAALGTDIAKLPDSFFVPDTVGGEMSRELHRLRQMRIRASIPFQREG